MNSAYQVEITVRAGSSLLRVFVEKMRQVCNELNSEYYHDIPSSLEIMLVHERTSGFS